MEEENKEPKAINPGLVSTMLKVLASDMVYSAKVADELQCYGYNASAISYMMGYIQGLKVGGRY